MTSEGLGTVSLFRQRHVTSAANEVLELPDGHWVLCDRKRVDNEPGTVLELDFLRRNLDELGFGRDRAVSAKT
jgi:hypothetical protein